KFDSFKMDYFLGGLFTKTPERVISTEPRYLDHAEELLNEENFAEIKAWMLVKFINGVAYSLSQDFREAAFPFSQALSGQPELSSGVKQAYHITNGDFGEVVGGFCGQSYFGEESEADVSDDVHMML